MILTKEININKYRVLADYKVKVKKSPFMSVLQLANEEEGVLTAETLYEKLMKPLSIKACDNLLIRLTSMGYFIENNEYEEDEWEDEWEDEVEYFYYKLTSFGKQSIEKDDFYDQRNGVLEIWIAEDNAFTSRVVKIDELNYDEDKEQETQRINSELQSVISGSKVVKLKNDAFTIDKIESQVKFLKSDDEVLTISLEDNNYKIQLVDFLEYRQEDKQKVVASILEREYENNYLPKECIVLTDFNNNDLSLVRDLKIERPVYKQTRFNAINISNVIVSPKNVEEAKTWFHAKLKQQIIKYFESDEEFIDYENKIASEFKLFKDELINTISRKQLIELFGEEDFYKRAKLETIDYLNY